LNPQPRWAVGPVPVDQILVKSNTSDARRSALDDGLRALGRMVVGDPMYSDPMYQDTEKQVKSSDLRGKAANMRSDPARRARCEDWAAGTSAAG
jgi:hypothetical protein